MDAVIVSIGDELLAGDTVNTNATWLAQRLTEHGVHVKKIITLPDDIEVIARELKTIRAGLIVVTGGLGATHDDITREAIAEATGRSIKRNKEALRAMGQSLSEAQMVMADLPEGAEVLGNPVGLAPGFKIDNILVLPGVPGEMKAIFTEYEEQLGGAGPPTVWLKTRLKESRIASVLKEAQDRFRVKIGSYPQGGQVRIKITADNVEDARAARAWLEEQFNRIV